MWAYRRKNDWKIIIVIWINGFCLLLGIHCKKLKITIQYVDFPVQYNLILLISSWIKIKYKSVKRLKSNIPLRSASKLPPNLGNGEWGVSMRSTSLNSASPPHGSNDLEQSRPPKPRTHWQSRVSGWQNPRPFGWPHSLGQADREHLWEQFNKKINLFAWPKCLSL